MGRRSSLLEDIFSMLAKSPWWVGVIAAVVFWIIGLIMSSKAPQAPAQQVFHVFAKFFFYFLSVLSLVAAAVSAIKGAARRKLLNQQDSIDSLRALPWREFEQLVGEAFRRQGFEVEETGGGGADGGVDLVLRGHGETALVQCKQWREQQVGVDKVRELFGVVTAEGANRGILVTSGSFTNDAKSFKVGKPLTLVDGPTLTQLVRDVQPAFPIANAPTPASKACPRCGSPMVLRTARRGANAGGSFYGCSRYPECKGTLPAD